MDAVSDHFLAMVEQMLLRPDARLLLEGLANDSKDPFQSHFATGFAHRVQAVAPGISPSLKVELYRRAANAFAESARNATHSVLALAEARHYEHEAFALITEAGSTAEHQTRGVLYERSCTLLGEALARLPERYRKTRSHLLGWHLLCRAKANGISADLEGDACSKSFAHQQSALLFGESAEHFREAGQESLANLSVAWQSFSAGWSSYFGCEIGEAKDRFRCALATFQASGRSDLAAACAQCLDVIGIDLGTRLYQGG